MRRFLVIIGVLLALMFVVNAPDDAAGMVRGLFDALDTFAAGLGGNADE